MREDWNFTFTSNLGPYEDNAIEIGNSLEEGQDPSLVCVVTSKDGFYCRPDDLVPIIERLQKIVDGRE